MNFHDSTSIKHDIIVYVLLPSYSFTHATLIDYAAMLHHHLPMPRP